LDERAPNRMGRPRHAQGDSRERHPACRHRPTLALRRARHPMMAVRSARRRGRAAA
jgi:hypothetical protein